MSNDVFIVNTENTVSSFCKTILGYRCAISENNAIPVYQDNNYPLKNAFDGYYSTEYSPDVVASPTSTILTFSFSVVEKINYFGIISKNAEESGLNIIVEVYRSTSMAYEQVSGFGSITNGVPVMVYFGDDFAAGYASCVSVRVTINYTSKPYIMAMACGEAIVFPRTFSLGAQPAHLSPIDEVELFYSDEGLNLAPSRRLTRGFQFKGSIGYVKISLIETFWREYSNHVIDIKPFFLMWNNNLAGEVIYGVQNPDRLTKPAYKTNLFSSIEFEVVGWA
jgi:hypothetical protein